MKKIIRIKVWNILGSKTGTLPIEALDDLISKSKEFTADWAVPLKEKGEGTWWAETAGEKLTITIENK